MEINKNVFIHIHRVDGVIRMHIPAIDLSGVETLSLHYTGIGVPGDDASSSNELNIPSSVKMLSLYGHMIDGIPVTPVLKFAEGKGLTAFAGCCLSFEFFKACCVQSPHLSKLVLCDILGFDVNGIDGWVSSGLTILKLVRCGLTEVPANIGAMFPLLVDLDLSYNNIKTLKGVDLPPLLNTIHLNGNKGITLEGAVFPRVENIYISDCAGLRGLVTAKFPDSLMHIGINDCDIRWLGSGFRWPKSTKAWFIHGNPLMDVRWVGSDDHNCFYYPREQLHTIPLYNTEDCIGLMRRWNVLSYDLLRTLRKFF